MINRFQLTSEARLRKKSQCDCKKAEEPPFHRRMKKKQPSFWSLARMATGLVIAASGVASESALPQATVLWQESLPSANLVALAADPDDGTAWTASVVQAQDGSARLVITRFLPSTGWNSVAAEIPLEGSVSALFITRRGGDSYVLCNASGIGSQSVGGPLLARIGPDGLRWVRRVVDSGSVRLTGVEVSNRGILVHGEFWVEAIVGGVKLETFQASYFSDGFLLALDLRGTVAAVRQFGSSYHDFVGAGAAVGDALYLCGAADYGARFDGTVSGGDGAFFMRIAEDGTAVWNRHTFIQSYNGMSSWAHAASAHGERAYFGGIHGRGFLAGIDPEGHGVYVPEPSTIDGFVVSMQSDGVTRWARAVSSSEFESVDHLAAGPGLVWVGGYSSATGFEIGETAVPNPRRAGFLVGLDVSDGSPQCFWPGPWESMLGLRAGPGDTAYVLYSRLDQDPGTGTSIYVWEVCQVASPSSSACTVSVAMHSVVTIKGTIGMTYDVQAADSIDGPWTTVGRIRLESSEAAWTDPLPARGRSRYYRAVQASGF